jgi:hypothetical protein
MIYNKGKNFLMVLSVKILLHGLINNNNNNGSFKYIINNDTETFKNFAIVDNNIWLFEIFIVILI